MGLRRVGAAAARRSSIFTLVLATTAACGSGSSIAGAGSGSSMASSGSSGSSTGSGSSSGSGSASGSGSISGSGSTSGVSSGSDSSGSAQGDDASESDASEADASQTDASSSPEAAPCVTGQVTANEVVMLGDSYLDPVWGNVGPTLMTEAGAMYRHYYIGAASMAWGNPDTILYIPYQYDPTALTDSAVTNPSDIKVVIMDGGGNDVLIGNDSCETTAPPANTSCVTTIQNAINQAKTTMQEMATKGVQNIVYFFYPHLSTAGGGILQTPAPAVNDTLDYAYPLVENVCCNTSFTSSLTNYSCTGSPAPGLSCTFIDTRPAFEGHLSDYIKSDNVHPTQQGAQVISDLIWTQMQNHCIAQ